MVNKNKQTVFVRLDTTLQVDLPACGECDGRNPCPMCRDAAVAAAVSIVRGSWAVESKLDKDFEDVNVYSDCSDADVEEIWIE